MNDPPNRPSVPPPHTDSATDTATPGPEATGAQMAPTDRVTVAGLSAPGFLGDFTVVQKLGEGGMGAVYLAEDAKLKRKVAIKTMRPELAANKLDRDRFEREARAAAAVEHDNIVPILHIGEAADGTPFIVMPFLKGEMLDARLKREPVAPLGLVLKVAREVADGLTAAHAAGLIHRDIKPANVWLEGDLTAEEPAQRVRRCKILDFGLARSVEKEDAQLTGPGAILGTPAFMAPEQARGEQVDPRADLFSLGATLYRMATGTLPFDGPTPMAVVIAVATETPTPVRELARHLPPELLDLIERLMSKDRERRPRSAAEVAATVRGIIEKLKEKKSTASAPSVAPPVVPVVAPAAKSISESFPQLLTPDEGPERPAPPAKRGRLPWVIAAASLLALVPLGWWLSGAFGEKKSAEHVEKTEGPPKTELPKQAPDRAAAVYVLSLGGNVDINVANENRNIRAVSELPTEPFRLRRVVVESARVTDAGLAVFKDCRYVMHLALPGTPVGDAGLAHFAGCKNLMYLHLNGTKVGDAGLLALGDGAELLDVNLNDTPVTDAGLVHLKRFTRLERLLLRGTTVSEKSVAELADALPKCRIEWDGGVFEPKTNIDADRRAAEYVLLIGGCVCVNDDDRQIMSAKDLPEGPFRLASVILTENTQVTDAGLVALAGCRHLLALGLNNTNVSDTGLAHLKECRNLMYLYLKGTKIGPAGLVHLKNCIELQELDLSYTAVTDAGLDHVRAFTKLHLLFLTQTPVTAAGVTDLAKALPKCEIEWDWGIRKPASDPDWLAALRVLTAGGSVQVNSKGKAIQSADALPKKPFKLTGISLTKPVKDADLSVVAGCKNLTSAYLVGTGLTNAGLAHFKGCENLTELFLSGTKVNDDSVPVIKQFTKLTDLSIGQTDISEKGVKELAKALPGCRIQHDGGTAGPNR